MATARRRPPCFVMLRLTRRYLGWTTAAQSGHSAANAGQPSAS